MSDLTDAERDAIRVAIANGYHDHTAGEKVATVVERIVTERMAQALEDMAEGIDPDDWNFGLAGLLRARAAELRGAPGQADNTGGEQVESKDQSRGCIPAARGESTQDTCADSGSVSVAFTARDDQVDGVSPPHPAPAVLCTCGHVYGWHKPNDEGKHTGQCLWPNGWPEKAACPCSRYTPVSAG